MTTSTLVALFLLRLNRILRKYQSLENQTWPTSIRPGWSNGMKHLFACSEFTELHYKPRFSQIVHQNNQENWKMHPKTYDICIQCIQIGDSLVMFCKRKTSMVGTHQWPCLQSTLAMDTLALPVFLSALRPSVEPLQCPHGVWNAPGAKGLGGVRRWWWLSCWVAVIFPKLWGGSDDDLIGGLLQYTLPKFNKNDETERRSLSFWDGIFAGRVTNLFKQKLEGVQFVCSISCEHRSMKLERVCRLMFQFLKVCHFHVSRDVMNLYPLLVHKMVSL